MRRSLITAIFVVLFSTFLPIVLPRFEVSAACPTLPTDKGMVTHVVNLSESGTYKVWSRMMASGPNNAYYLQIDDNICGISVGDSSNVSSSAWTWVDWSGGNTATKTSFTLSAGNHTVRLIGKESGVTIDKLLFITDQNCIPTGTGGNCSVAASITPAPTALTTSSKLNVTIGLHGIGKGGDAVNPLGVGNMDPLRKQRTITVDVLDSQNQSIIKKQGTVTYNATSGLFAGTIDLGTTVPSGAYRLKVKEPQYLQTQLSEIITLNAGTNTIPKITLRTGDINNDNSVNISDFNILLGCFSELTPAKNCTTTTKLQSDITDDGSVNQFDYNLFIRTISQRSGA